jgi:hypothetical protein
MRCSRIAAVLLLVLAGCGPKRTGVPYLGSFECRDPRGSAPPVWDVSPAGEVHGMVADTSGRPLAGASVALADARGGRATVQARSDSTGAFTLRGVQPGRWDASVALLGYAALRRRVEVRVGTDTVHARLEAAAICLSA